MAPPARAAQPPVLAHCEGMPRRGLQQMAARRQAPLGRLAASTRDWKRTSAERVASNGDRPQPRRLARKAAQRARALGAQPALLQPQLGQHGARVAHHSIRERHHPSIGVDCAHRLRSRAQGAEAEAAQWVGREVEVLHSARRCAQEPRHRAAAVRSYAASGEVQPRHGRSGTRLQQHIDQLACRVVLQARVGEAEAARRPSRVWLGLAEAAGQQPVEQLGHGAATGDACRAAMSRPRPRAAADRYRAATLQQGLQARALRARHPSRRRRPHHDHHHRRNHRCAVVRRRRSSVIVEIDLYTL